MAKYRVTVDVEQTARRPDAGSSTPKFFTKNYWQNEFTIEGDNHIVAQALRAMADKLSPEA